MVPADAALRRGPLIAAASITDLLARKCSLAASLAVATAMEMERRDIVRLAAAPPVTYNDTQLDLWQRLRRQMRFAERLAVYVAMQGTPGFCHASADGTRGVRRRAW